VRDQIAEELRSVRNGVPFYTILADPPWQFDNRTGKVAPEHKRLARYGTLRLPDIMKMPVAELTGDSAHLYLWVPNAMLPEGLEVMRAWGFNYKSNIVWHKVRKDGGPDGRGVGFYFRNTTELILFGIRGKNARTLAPGRRQVNIIKTQKREHSRKPDELYDLIESCSPGPYLELFARGPRKGWIVWGDQSADYAPSWATYANHSGAENTIGHLLAARQKGDVANSLRGRQVAKQPTIADCLAPQDFIKGALKTAPGRKVSAGAARDAYARHCDALGKSRAADILFWRSLSANAVRLGAKKTIVEGKVTYSGLKLAGC
jgi:N6-adenosine-specific RNA methylase IME4